MKVKLSIDFVRQVSDEMKAQVPEEVLKAARQMNRKAYEERLRQIKYVFTKAFTFYVYQALLINTVTI